MSSLARSSFIPGIQAVLMGLCLYALAWPVVDASAASGDLRVRIEGTAPGDSPASAEAAVKNAEQAAVLQTLEGVLGSSAAEGSAAIVLKTPERYIQGTRLRKVEQDAGITKIEIETYVQKNQLLQDALSAIRKNLTTEPRLRLLVAEQWPALPTQNPELSPAPTIKVSESNAGPKTLAEELRKQHIHVVSNEDIHTRYTPEELAARIQGELETASQLAREDLVDAVALIDARVETRKISSRNEVTENRATVNMRVFRSSDGKLLDARSDEAVVSSRDIREGGDQAIVDACCKVRDAIVTACILAVADTPTREGLVLTVNGLGERSRFDELLETLRAMPGAGALNEQFFSPAQARVTVDFDPMQLALFVDTLREHAFSDFSLDTEMAAGSEITMTAKIR